MAVRPQRLPGRGAEARAARGSARSPVSLAGAAAVMPVPPGAPGHGRCAAPEQALPPRAQVSAARRARCRPAGAARGGDGFVR